MQRSVEFQFLLDDGDQHVHADGNLQLSFHRVLGGAVEALDSQLLLGPFEEEFDLPATFVQRAYLRRRELAVIGQEDKSIARLGVAVTDTPRMLRVVAGRVEVVERDTLIASPPVPRSTGAKQTRRATMLCLTRVTKKLPA